MRSSRASTLTPALRWLSQLYLMRLALGNSSATPRASVSCSKWKRSFPPIGRPQLLDLSRRFWTKFQLPASIHLVSRGRDARSSYQRAERILGELASAYTIKAAISPPGRPEKRTHGALPHRDWPSPNTRCAIDGATHEQMPPQPAPGPRKCWRLHWGRPNFCPCWLMVHPRLPLSRLEAFLMVVCPRDGRHRRFLLKGAIGRKDPTTHQWLGQDLQMLWDLSPPNGLVANHTAALFRSCPRHFSCGEL